MQNRRNVNDSTSKKKKAQQMERIIGNWAELTNERTYDNETMTMCICIFLLNNNEMHSTKCNEEHKQRFFSVFDI